MIQCKNTERLSQAGNDKTTNLQEHNCKAKWDGLHSMDTVSNIFINTDKAKALTMNNQPGKSTDKKNGAGVDSSSTYVLPQKNALYRFLPKHKKRPRILVFLNKRRRRHHKMN